MVGYWAPGQPDFPLEEDGGAPKRGRGVQQHATYSILFESSIVNTGSFLKDAKGEWEVGKGAPNETPMPQEVADGA
jgi:hypothetical protein